MELNELIREAIIYSNAKVDLEKEQLVFDRDAMVRYTESIIKAVCEEMVCSSEFNVKDEDDGE